MSEVRKLIREQSRFTRMRLGQDAPELVDIPSMKGVRVAIVPLMERESQQGQIRAANLDVPDNLAGVNARNRAAVVNDVWNATRDPQNVDQRIWDTPEQMEEEIEPTDIDWLFEQLTTLVEYASPSFEDLTDKALDDLKKGFVAIDWRGLSGKQASALVLCISRLLPELLAAKFSSSGSTSSSTMRSETEESTPIASQS